MNKKTTTRKKIDDTKTVDSVKALAAPAVVNEIGSLQVTIQSTLANVAAAITGKLEQLNNTEAAISTMEERLNELYLIEKEALSLEEMKTVRAEEQVKFDKMVSDRNAEWCEELNHRNKKWQREEEEHNYTTTQSKKKFADEFNAEIESHKRSEKIRTEELLKGWDQRETELKGRETEVADLKKNVADFDTRIKTEVSKAEAIATNSVKKQYEHQMQLLQKDMESERNMSDSKIQALQLQIAGMQHQIAELNTQLISARTDAKEVTAQALQSASGRQVADALQRAMDSKDTGKSK